MTASTATSLETPSPALCRWLQRLRPVATETIDATAAGGRVLAESLRADRDSPPGNVSAMDGYAVRLADLNGRLLSVTGEVAIGHAPLELPPGGAMRIFTGGCVPIGAEAIVRREDVVESDSAIRLRIEPQSIQSGDHIRRQGENARAGQPILSVGRQISGAAAAAMAAFGMNRPWVFRKVRLGLLITGDEILPPDIEPKPWQQRDSNGPALHGMFSHVPWIEMVRTLRAVDALPAITAGLNQLLACCDSVFITGGVSMGDHDYVPAAVRNAGCDVVFHKLLIRPGKPLLASTGPRGQAILGLPGNPVSVVVTARRFGVAALRQVAGFSQPDPPCPTVRMADPDRRSIKLWWYRPVRLEDAGRAAIAPHMGSGDVAGTAYSDGFVEIAPESPDFDGLPFWSWQVS